MELHSTRGRSPLDLLVHAAQHSEYRLSQLPVPPAKLAEQQEDDNNYRKKNMACVECRQQKAKCDASVRAPEPCTRCIKRGYECHLDSNYKRTYKRARMAEIERELNQLRSSIAAALNTPAPMPPSTAITPSAPQALPHAPSPIHGSPQLAPYSPGGLLTGLVPEGLQQQVKIEGGRPPHAAIPPIAGHPAPAHPPLPPLPRVAPVPAVMPPPPGDASSPFHVPTSPLTNSLLDCPPQLLGDTTLDLAQIALLFQEYATNYHPILPVVDVLKGPARIHRLCPALFWTIMLTGLRRAPLGNAHDLLRRLVPELKAVLLEITILPITRYNPSELDEPILNDLLVYSVQAFLLYTYWPPITSLLSADTSWTTVGTAMFNAFRLGLHHPQGMLSNAFDSAGPGGISGKMTPLPIAHENLQTWIGCNIVLQVIATAFGFPAFVLFDTLVLYAHPGAARRGAAVGSAIVSAAAEHVPGPLRQMMLVAHFEDQAAKTLNTSTIATLGVLDAVERVPLLLVLEGQLDELERQLPQFGPVDAYRQFQLLAARVHLCSYYFLDSQRLAPFQLQRGLVKAYNAAVALVAHCHLSTQRHPSFVRYLPAVYILTLWQAACVVGKLYHLPLLLVLDLGTGREMYHHAVQLAMQALILDHDLAFRLLGIMRSMWLLFLAMNAQGMMSPGVYINGKMAASVFFDCLWVLRTKVGMIQLLRQRAGQGAGPGAEAAAEGPDSRPPVLSRRGGARRLSNENHESHARQIIQTVPLDPQPIVVTPNGERGLLVRIASELPPEEVIARRRRAEGNAYSPGQPSPLGRPAQAEDAPLVPLLFLLNDLPSAALDGDWDNGTLWKNVELMMNDFAFNMDDYVGVPDGG